MQPLSHWQYLLQQYLNDTATEEERMQLFEALQRNEVDWELMLVQLGLQQERDAAYRPEAFTAMIEQVMQQRPQKRTIYNLRWWMAAAVFLFVVVGVWLVVGRSKSKPAETSVPAIVQDVLPGKQGAVLTLADGRQIVIDSAGNGNLAQQGNTTVRRVGDELMYESNKEEQPESSPAIAYNMLLTPRGRQFQLVLPDGSKVWLNAASSIRYPVVFAANERRVEITGEAYFEVKSQGEAKTKIPFIVTMPGGNAVEVLGTKFNVNAYSDEPAIKTTLLEGKVQVNKAMVLKPGEQAVMAGTHSPLTIHHSPNMEQVMAWKNGVFNFEDQNLQQIMRQLSRWYDIEVTYENGIPAIEFGGKMGRDLSLMNVLRFLEKSGLRCRLEGERTLIVLQ